MLKKVMWVGGAGAALLTAVCGRDASSYLATSWGQAKETVRQAIPTPFELERARQMVDQLEPEMRDWMRTVAKEEIELERLQSQVDQLESQQKAERENLQQLSSDLQSGGTRFVYSGRDYTADQVRQDLKDRFECYKTNDQTLTSLQSMLAARENSLAKARRKVSEMVSMKTRLISEISNLEARHQLVQIHHATSDLKVDDSQLARTRELLDEIRTRIEVDEKVQAAEQSWARVIPVEPSGDEDVVSQVAAYFQSSAVTPEVESLAENSP
ncbi:MAG: hypothetical protein U0795_18415 [Pirellulales bacterium]